MANQLKGRRWWRRPLSDLLRTGRASSPVNEVVNNKTDSLKSVSVTFPDVEKISKTQVKKRKGKTVYIMEDSDLVMGK